MTFKQYKKSQQINENWMYTVAQIVDPTGVFSYYDAVVAAKKAITEPSNINTILFALAAFAALPNMGLLAAGVGGVPWAAAKAAAKGAAKNPKLLEKAGTLVLGLLRKEPAKTALEKFVGKMIKGGTVTEIQAKALLGTIEKGAGFRLTKADVGALAKGAKGAGTYVATKPVIAKAGSEIVGNIGSKAGQAAGKQAVFTKGTRLKTMARALPAATGFAQQKMKDVNTSIQGAAAETDQQTQNDQDTVTYTDPKTGKQVQTTKQALQDAGIAPLDAPQPQYVPTFGGRVLTPAQANALGGFATPYMPNIKPGTMSPQNIPQGATPDAPLGREGMPPAEYMKPDNFNNPPRFFNKPQTRNYGNPQQNAPYDDQNYGGQPNPMAMINGMMNGGVAGSPVQGLMGLASGLMGLLPGMAGGMGGGMGGGMNPMAMLPGLMGGI